VKESRRPPASLMPVYTFLRLFRPYRDRGGTEGNFLPRQIAVAGRPRQGPDTAATSTILKPTSAVTPRKRNQRQGEHCLLKDTYNFLPTNVTFEEIEQAIGLTPDEVINAINELADLGLLMADNFTDKGFRQLIPADHRTQRELKKVSAELDRDSLAIAAVSINGIVN